jgi:hypothetical protein
MRTNGGPPNGAVQGMQNGFAFACVAAGFVLVLFMAAASFYCRITESQFEGENAAPGARRRT